MSYLIINIQLAVQLAKCLSIEVKKLSRSYPIWGYNGQSGTPIEHAILFNWEIDGWIFKNKPFLITNLGWHNMIIRLKWLKTWRILLDCHQRQFIWPEEASQEEEIQSQLMLTLPKEILKCLNHCSNLVEIQTNINWYEKLLAYEDKIWAAKNTDGLSKLKGMSNQTDQEPILNLTDTSDKGMGLAKTRTGVPFRPHLLSTEDLIVCRTCKRCNKNWN